MGTIQRSIKRGDVRQFDESYAKGFKNAWASEVDADFNILFDSWNNGFPGNLALADGSVTNAKLADGSVTNSKLAANSVNSGNIIDGAVTTVDIQDGAITGPKIAGGVIDLTKLAANSVDASKIVDGSVGSAELAANSVTTPKIVDLNVTTVKIADGAVTDAKITSVAWAKITGAPAGMAPSGAAGGSLAGTYPNPTIAANAVGPNEILDGCVSTTELAPNVNQRLTPPYGVPQASMVLSVDATGTSVVWQAAPPATLTPGQVTTPYIADAPNGVTDAKITSVAWTKVTGAPTSLPPSGPAGGDLAGTYPNPTIKPGLIPVIPTSLPPSGPAGGNLTGNYPNPTIGAGQVTNAMVADVAWSKLTGTTGAIVDADINATANINWNKMAATGSVGGDLGGTMPNPTVIPTVKSKWTDSGTVLSPTPAAYAGKLSLDSTGHLALPADTNQLVLGPSTIKSRIRGFSTGALGFSTNRTDADGQDDATRPTWRMTMNPAAGADTWAIDRKVPGGGTFANLLTLDNTGNLIVANPTQAIRVLLGPLSAGGVFLAANNSFAPDVPASPSWSLLLDASATDKCYIQRRAGGAAAGGGANLLTLDNLGDLTTGMGTVKTVWRGADTAAAIRYNRDNVGTQQDVSKPGWVLQVGGSGANDSAAFFRAAPGNGALTTLLALDSAGVLTVPGSTMSAEALRIGSRTIKGRLATHGTVDSTYLTSNAVLNASSTAWVQDDVSKSSWVLRLDTNGDVFTLGRIAPGGTLTGTPMQTIDASGNLTIVGATATKASGTTWANPSDERMKRDVADYGTGLAAITQLRPVSFKYNGQFGSVDDDRLCYGFVAQEVEPVMPECVGERDYFPLGPDNPTATRIKTLDQSNMILALVNAVKELAARVQALEAA